MLKKVTWVALFSSMAFAGIGYGVGVFFGFTFIESLVIGAATMFSSTIVGLKLLPTTMLHHKHIGELMISVLLMQDLIAISVLVLLNGAGNDGLSLTDVGLLIVGLPAIVTLAFVCERYILLPLLKRFERTQEYVFLLSIGWCLGFAELAHYLGLSEETGAFIAGITLASSPIALYIAENLRPLRDFCLIMFFFSIGAGFDFSYWKVVWIPGLALAGLTLLLKPLVFHVLFRGIGETKPVATEVAIRLGQSSEFSLLVASLAISTALIGQTTLYLIQAATIVTFIASSYITVLRYDTSGN